MGIQKAIPSFGALTPAESLIKGGSAGDLFNPANIMGDTMSAINKPSSLLTNPIKDKGQTMTKQQDTADAIAADAKMRETNKWLNWTPDRNSKATKSSTGLSI